MAVETTFVFSGWIEVNSIFVSGQRNRLNFRGGIEIDLISVMGSNLLLFLAWGIEMELVLVWVSKLAFLCGGSDFVVVFGRKSFGFHGSKFTCF